MKLEMIVNVKRGHIELKRGDIYEIEEIVQDTYKIKVPKKQRGKFDYVLINDADGKMIN